MTTDIAALNLIGVTKAAADNGVLPRMARKRAAAAESAGKEWPRLNASGDHVAPASEWAKLLAKPKGTGGRKRASQMKAPDETAAPWLGLRPLQCVKQEALASWLGVSRRTIERGQVYGNLPIGLEAGPLAEWWQAHREDFLITHSINA